MVQRRETGQYALQKMEHEPRGSEVVWAVAMLVARVVEFWGKSAHLQVESTFALENYDGALT